MLPTNKPPKLVICAGLPRSGSTWIYNATLMLLRSCTNAIGLFSETVPHELDALTDSGACLVIKCHRPDAALLGLAKMVEAPVIVTVRDPRDCLASLRSSFQIPTMDGLGFLIGSASALERLDDHPRRLVLKYEDSPDQPKAVRAIAALIGVPANAELVEQIAGELSRDAVKENIDRWQEAGVLDSTRPVEVWTNESQWHANHCGDGAVGKYVDCLSPATASFVSRSLRAFFSAYGYQPSSPPAVESGETLEFNGDGAAYLLDGFSWVESWGVWTQEPAAHLNVPLAAPARRFQVELSLMRGPNFQDTTSRSIAELIINRRHVVNLFAGPHGSETLVVYDCDAPCEAIQVDFKFEGLATPRALGLSEDDRLLGVGLRTLRLTYH